MAGDNISTGYRHRKFSPIGCKIAGQFPVGFTHCISFQRLRVRFNGCSGSGSLTFFTLRFLTGGSLASGFFLGTLAGTFYFFCNQLVNAGIQLVSFSPFLIDLTLQPSLFLLQIGHKRTFFLLLRFQFGLLAFTLFQQTFFSGFHLFPFHLFLPYLFLFLQDFLTLQPLISSIFTNIAHTAVSLPEILGRENKHQFFFNRLVLIQVLDRSLILFLLILQILLQTVQLTLQGSQFTFYRFHVIIDSNDITFPLLDLAGQYRQTIQLTTHIFLCILQD